MEKQLNTANSSNKTKNIYRITLIFLFILLYYKVFTYACTLGVNSDYYFIVNTGKWIVENKAVPHENIWTMHENFKIVIQQWILCVIQYKWYCLFNNQLIHLASLAVIFTIIFNISLYRYIRLFTSRQDISLIAIIVGNLAILDYLSTRPNVITASTLLIELTILYKYYINKEISYKQFLIEMVILSIWQINFQAASWYFLIIMMLPYMVPPIWQRGWIIGDKDSDWSIQLNEYKHRLKTGLIAIVLVLISGLINPYGIDNMLYLFNSRSLSATGDAINELHSNGLYSRIGALLLIEAFLFGALLIKKKVQVETIWLTLGTMLLATIAGRNCYMIVYGIVPLVATALNSLLPTLKDKCVTTQAKYTTLICLYTFITICLIAIFSIKYSNLGTSEDEDELNKLLHKQVEYLEENEQANKENITIYTPFETGQYFEFYGYKTYMDARPELYMKTINKQEDIWSEWYDLHTKNDYSDEAVEAFLSKYNFDYLCVNRVGYIGAYLRSNEGYEEVVKDGTMSLFKNLNKAE